MAHAVLPSTHHLIHIIVASLFQSRRLFGNSVLGGPLLGRRDSSLLILLPALGNIGSKRVVGVRGTQEGLDGQEDGTDLEGGGPVVCKGSSLLALAHQPNFILQTTHSSGRRGRYGRACRHWGGRSW